MNMETFWEMFKTINNYFLPNQFIYLKEGFDLNILFKIHIKWH